jgi:hypothetical protein
MVTCNNCGYEYQSKVLQAPDEETLRSDKDIMENYPKCSQISSHSGADFYWIDPWELDLHYSRLESDIRFYI